MTRRPTLEDVSRHAGVSTKTVSRVVNGMPHVHDDVRARVLAVVEQLHYVPNSFARALKSQVNDTIGIVVNSIADPFFAALASAVEEQAYEAGMNVIIGSTRLDPDRERQLIQRMAMQQVAGIVLAPVGESHTYLQQLRASVPIVLVDRSLELSGYDLVAVDDRGVSRAAVTHLIKHGHRRIAFVGTGTGARFKTMEERLAGYREALRDNDLEAPAEWVVAPPGGKGDVVELVRGLLTSERVPTALFASSESAGIAAAHALHTSGRNDIAFVSFGDFPLSQTLRPATTFVNHDPAAIGRLATTRVLELIAGRNKRTQGGSDEDAVFSVSRDDVRGRVLLVDTEIVARGSGELTP